MVQYYDKTWAGHLGKKAGVVYWSGVVANWWLQSIVMLFHIV